ncbi:MAG TPA: RNA polymerase sigma factor [Rhizomicrobium sp.]|nr:RNA polymerase sigma factor [Rhizomicrobium sp.]
MADRSEHGFGHHSVSIGDVSVESSAVDAWFLREVLPLEGELSGYFRRNWRNESDVRDLVQEVYVRVYAHAAATPELPQKTRAFVFTTARNLLLNKSRDAQVVPLEMVGDVEGLAAASDQPGPDRAVIGRDELRRLQTALDQLAPRCREAILLRQLEGLSRKEIALRMGIGEATVKDYLAVGLFALSDIFFGASGNGRAQ